MDSRQAAPTVTRVDRWRYRSAVQAARVLNSVGRRDATDARSRTEDRPRAGAMRAASR